MKLKEIRILIVALLTFNVFAYGSTATSENIKIQVDSILINDDRTHSEVGNEDQRLANLGVEAVPVLIEKLKTFQFPVVIVKALGRIGDSRATPHLTQFLSKKLSTGNVAEAKVALEALKRIGDNAALPLLRDIQANEENVLGIRLAAAGALARLGWSEDRANASTFIIDTAKKLRQSQINLHTSGPFSPTDLDEALSEVRSIESKQILVDNLLTSGLTYEESYIIGLFSEIQDERITEALFSFCENPRKEASIRLQAANVLTTRKHIRYDRLLNVLYGLREESVTNYLDSKTIDNLIESVNKDWQNSKND